MSNIEQYLADILAARYGEEVRQSIHDAIQQCYEDGRAGAIDLEAREDIAAETTAREALDTRVNGIDTRVETLENDTTTAEEVTYDDTSTQLGATNVQGAIGALNNNLATIFPSNNFKIESDTSHSNVLEVSLASPRDIINMPHLIHQHSSRTALRNIPSDISGEWIGLRFVHFFDSQNVVVEMVQLAAPFAHYYSKWNGVGFGSWYKSVATVVS